MIDPRAVRSCSLSKLRGSYTQTCAITLNSKRATFTHASALHITHMKKRRCGRIEACPPAPRSGGNYSSKQAWARRDTSLSLSPLSANSLARTLRGVGAGLLSLVPDLSDSENTFDSVYLWLPILSRFAISLSWLSSWAGCVLSRSLKELPPLSSLFFWCDIVSLSPLTL